MIRCVVWVSGTLAVASLASVADPVRAQQRGPTIEDILQVWKARQDKVATAHFELKRKELIPKGSNWLLQTERARMGKGSGEPDPPRDYEVEGTATLWLDGGKLHYASDVPVWCPRTKVIRPEHYETAFDGQVSKSLRVPASGEHPYPSGRVAKAGRSESAESFSLLPLTVTLRGDHEQFIRDLLHYEVTGRTVPVRDRPCLELVAEQRGRNRRDVLHLDRDRGYAVVRKTTLVDDKPTWQIDVTHAADPLIGWVPKSWEYVTRAGKERLLTDSGQVTVTRYELNGPVPEGEFDLAFPVGTRVFDTTSGTELQSVIQGDGAKGKELPLSQNPTYEALAAPAEPVRSGNLVTVVVSVAIGAACLGALLWFRRRHRGGPTSLVNPTVG